MDGNWQYHPVLDEDIMSVVSARAGYTSQAQSPCIFTVVVMNLPQACLYACPQPAQSIHATVLTRLVTGPLGICIAIACTAG